jgi:histidyl-tRNA synthetase
MAKVNASIPQGTRDFGPETVRKRNHIFNTIRSVFELYGFQPLETPAMENMETLMGKYGDEGDKLIFKILNNGLSDPKNIEKTKAAFENVLNGKNDKDLTERALRYDLTIPFARYVAMNYGQLTMPFKRYQMQPVWRADRPQKGRYREFYQCDADVVGSNSLINEVELAIIYATVFEKLGIEVEIKINSRKVLSALAELVRLYGYQPGAGMTAGMPPPGNKPLSETNEMITIATAIEKLDKIGIDKVKDELVQKGLNVAQITLIEKYLLIEGSNEEKLIQIKELFQHNNMPDETKKGIEEIEFILGYSPLTTHYSPLTISPPCNPSLASASSISRRCLPGRSAATSWCCWVPTSSRSSAPAATTCAAGPPTRTGRHATCRPPSWASTPTSAFLRWTSPSRNRSRSFGASPPGPT